jgi:hypothetical protein
MARSSDASRRCEDSPPIAFYSDKHAIFRVNKADAEGGMGMTQFGRALREINVDILCANSAPAKGRIERCFGTLQDRFLTDVFAWKEERTVSNALTLQYDKVMFLLERNEVTRPLARKRVTVYDYPDGRVVIRHEGRGTALAYVAERQKQYDEQRSLKAPRRRGQIDRHMFRTV